MLEKDKQNIEYNELVSDVDTNNIQNNQETNISNNKLSIKAKFIKLYRNKFKHNHFSNNTLKQSKPNIINPFEKKLVENNTLNFKISNEDTILKDTLFNTPSLKDKKTKKNIQEYYRHIPAILFGCLALSLFSPQFNKDISHLVCSDCLLYTPTHNEQNAIYNAQLLKDLTPNYSFEISTPTINKTINIFINDNPHPERLIQSLSDKQTSILISSDIAQTDSMKEAIETRINDFKLDISKDAYLNAADINLDDRMKKLHIISEKEELLLKDLSDIYKK